MKVMKYLMMFLVASVLLFGQQGTEDKKYKLMEFRNANINSVLNYISDITGMTIITHPDLKGSVTIINKEELTQNQIIDILYSTLRDLGFTIERRDNILTVVPLSQERIKTELRTDEDISQLPEGDQIITYIITLKYVNAESIINNIRPFMSKYGNVSINAKMNKIILTDAASNIKKIFQIIKELDKQGEAQGKETEIIYLKYISIDKMERIILDGLYDVKIIDTAYPATQKISPRSEVQKEPTLRLIKLTEANAFIAIGNRDEIENVKNFVKKIDIQVTQTSPEIKFMIIPLKFLNPKKMIELINQIYTAQPTQNATESWRRSDATAVKSGSGLSQNSRVLEFPERNALIFIGTEEDFRKIKEVVDVFEKEIKDTGFKAGEVVTKVFHLQNQKADDVAQALRAAFPSVQGVFYPDKNINCIIVSVPSEKIYDISKMLDELDKKMSQVLIKVLIVEVTFSDQSQVGVDWSAVASLPDVAKNVIPGLNIMQKYGTSATSGFTIQSTGLNFILNALQTLGNVNVLSTPHILTLDNKEAVINIGKKIAFVTETLSISGADQNQITTSKKVDYRDVGLKLTVKPQINDEKTVTMDIAQAVNDVESSGNPDYPNIITREITSTIMVGNNQTGVLGGLMETKKSVDTKQIPFLGYIPLLGYLFKYEVAKEEKTELVLFITPYVILSSQDMQNAKDDMVRKAPQFSKEQMQEITNNAVKEK